LLTLPSLIMFVCGIICGYILSLFIQKRAGKEGFNIISQVVSENKEHQKTLFDSYLNNLKSSLKEQSLDNLQRSTETTFKLTSEQLSNNRKSFTQELSNNRTYIEKQITDMLERVKELGSLVHNMEGNTGKTFGEMSSLLKQTNQQTQSLISTTTAIKEVLSNSQARGFWGEKIAEDILKHSGLIHNIHYKKQTTLKSGSRPDFTFLLPNSLMLHMDVKFPLENYKKYVHAESEGQNSKNFEKNFITDIKNTTRSLLTRDYIDADTTVGCVLLFLPNEQIMSFIQEKKPEIIEECLKQQIILCSPMSLLSILMIIRKSIETFKIKQTSQDLMSCMNQFNKQWQLYTKGFVTLGKRIKDLESEYDKLTTTRTKQLGSIVEKMNHMSPNSEGDKLSE